jgi:tellurite resistance protein
LSIARICPRCHTPLLAATIRGMPPPVAEAVIDAAIALAWAGGEAAVEERGYLKALLKASPVPSDRQKLFRQRIEAGATVASLSLPVLTPAESQEVLRGAATLVTIDGKLLASEMAAYEQLAAKLGVAENQANSVLSNQRKLAWV